MSSEHSGKALKRKYEKKWLKLDGVLAVGLGRDEGRPAIIVSVNTDPDFFSNQIPESIEGVKVVIRKTGEFRAL